MWFLLLVSVGCPGGAGNKPSEDSDPREETGAETGESGATDLDGDGHAAPADCDDGDDTRFPGAPEACNGVDDDCDSEVDEDAVDAPTWYADADADQYGDPATSTSACEAPPGAVADAGDCDDARADVNPGAAETDCADPTDYNCDGVVAWRDDDGDGSAACLDCDDRDSARSPDLSEVCDSADRDEDCDGLADEADPSLADAQTWHRDVDADGYGTDAGVTVEACDPPEGFAAAVGDCDDYDPTVHPAATEVCDDHDVDEDCNGAADDADGGTDAASWTTWYADRDGDAYGDPSRGATQCEPPPDYVAVDGDCDDDDAERNPGQAERCDDADRDEDCDGVADEADADVVDAGVYYADADADGYGTGIPARACTPAAGTAAMDGDCDDADPAVNPGAAEACDPADRDEDCDGFVDGADPGVTGTSAYFEDSDGDGFGAGLAVRACDPAAGQVGTDGDCDDGDPAVNPDAVETCDSADRDEDCDGAADGSDAVGVSTWYADADGDGFGVETVACDAPAGAADVGGDCDDGDGAVHPGATDTCEDGVDADCSGDDPICEAEPYAGTYAADDEVSTFLYGVEASDNFGEATVGGDFDGDGLGELVVASSRADADGRSDHGVVYHYLSPLGRGSQQADDDPSTAWLNTIATYAGTFGYYLDNLGDLDGDGRDDLWIATTSSTGAGFLGGDAGTLDAPTVDDLGAACGRATAAGAFDTTAGDNDWACSDTTYDASAGVVYVFAGTSTRSPTFTLQGEAPYGRTGRDLAGGEDVDGDGWDDLWVGTYGLGLLASGGGAAHLVYGPASGTLALADADVIVGGAWASGQLGAAVAIAPDVDGDGAPNLVAGAPYSGLAGDNRGAAYVLDSLPDGTHDADDVALAVLVGTNAYDTAGATLAVGDIDGNELTDVAVASIGWDAPGSNSGAVWLQYAPMAGMVELSADANAGWTGLESSDYLGTGLSILADADGDGDDELVLGGGAADVVGRASAGGVWLWAGR